MDEEKPNPLVDHKKQPEEAVVHHAVVMEIEEANMQDAHNHTQELVAIPNLKEEVTIRDAIAIVDIVETSTLDATMEEEEEDIGEKPLLLPMNALVQRLRPLHEDLPRNTDITTTAPHVAEVEQGVNRFDGFFNDEDEDYVDYIAIMVQAERNARTVPLERRTQAPAMARIFLFASADSQAIYPSMKERDNNGSYDFILYDTIKIEHMVDPGIDGIPPPLELSRSEETKEELGDHHPSGEEDNAELSLQYIKKIWGHHPSELNPDEPGPSIRRQLKVAPLTDDEVAKFDCGICLETLLIFDIFRGMPCPHKFCVRCLGTYIEGRIHAGEVLIPCPDPTCNKEGNGILHPEDCKKSIDFAVFCNWSDKLTENAIPPNKRVYCPNPECRIMLESTCTNTTPSKASCPMCNCQMCTTCGIDWSTDGSGQHDCAEGPEAMLMKKLATERRWKQCPQCRILVERNGGCNVMTCRCLAVFCYTCGRLKRPVLEEGVEMCRCRNRY
ncbi:hypothetical protein PAHAL_2G274900 [Panicum hallii]|uniref:RBR-type E3 ubiquitin transferase n=2 Tax=Panicum hallii TaxID=206008 RepID=A0A2T8KQJ9_9POAL|nr:hypothetical protein PAHAL_2G274900 [Panicum hallii]